MPSRECGEHLAQRVFCQGDGSSGELRNSWTEHYLFRLPRGKIVGIVKNDKSGGSPAVTIYFGVRALQAVFCETITNEPHRCRPRRRWRGVPLQKK